MPSDKPVSRASEHRRTNKPIMEKKRRARINNCLNELKNLLLEAMRKDPARHTKLEKADILEMTVKYLQNLQRQQAALSAAADPGVVTKFRAGFNECAEEVSRFVSGQTADGMDGAVRQRLLGHLANCVNGFDTMSGASANVGTSATGFGTVASSSSDTGSGQLPLPIRARLADADLAGLLASAVQQQQRQREQQHACVAGWPLFPSYRDQQHGHHHHHHRHPSSSAAASRTDSSTDDSDCGRRGSADFGALASDSGNQSGSDTSDASGRHPATRYRRRYQAYQQPNRQQQQQQVPEHVFAVPRQSAYPTANYAVNANSNCGGDSLLQQSSVGNALYLSAAAADTTFLLSEYVGIRRDSGLSDLGSISGSSLSGGGSSSEDATGSISSCSGSSRYSSATSAVAMDFSDCEEDLEGEQEQGLEEGEGAEEIDPACMMPVDLSKDADKMWRPW